jgi:hypothetical protein
VSPDIHIRAMQPADADAVAQLTTQLGYNRTPQHIADWLSHLHASSAEQAVFVASLND